MGMGLRVLLVSCLVVAITTGLPRADFGAAGGEHHHDHHVHHEHQAEDHAEEAVPAASEKQCRLERASTATSPECFLEPECQNTCNDVTNPVCEQIQENVCQTFDEPICNMVNENVVKTEYETVCSSGVERQCRDITKNQCDTVVE